MSGAVLDTGALVGFDRNDRRVVAIVARALEHRDPLVVPVGVVAQTWRDGRTQVRLSRLLGSPVCEIVPLDDLAARSVGQLCGATGTDDITDAAVARARHVNVGCESSPRTPTTSDDSTVASTSYRSERTARQRNRPDSLTLAFVTTGGLPPLERGGFRLGG